MQSGKELCRFCSLFLPIEMPSSHWGPVAQDQIQFSSEHLQEWRSHHLSIHSNVKLDHPDDENFLPKIRTLNFRTVQVC